MSTKRKQKIKKSIEQFIDSNMPKIEYHGGSFAIYEINIPQRYIRLKFAGSCTTCSNGHYKFEQLQKRIPDEFKEIDNVLIEFV